MFSFLFGGKVGEFLAPRTISNKELWSWIKAGLTDKALAELRNPSNKFEIDALDPSTGLSLLHVACAQGSLELVVELLSMGADVSLFSVDGNNCLHFAAINDRKGIVEVLLRSGADPSVPNKAGTLPVELANESSVKELFFRDRSAVFSPIVQTRMLLSDYIEQMNLNEKPTGKGAASVTETNEPAVGGSLLSDHSNTSGSVHANLAEVLDPAAADLSPGAPVLKTTPFVAQETPLSINIAASPVRLERQFSALDSPATTTVLHRDQSGDYTLVGVASVKKPQNPNGGGSSSTNASRVVEDYDSSESAATTRNRHSLQELAGAPRTPIPKLNLGELATLSPPPTDMECALQALAIGSGGFHSARRSGQPPNASASSASASRNNSVSFYQAQPVPVPAVIGAVTTPRTSRSDTNNPLGVPASTSLEATPSGGPAIALGVDDSLESQHQEAAEVRHEVLRAAAQTAVALQSNRDDFEARRLVVRNCQKLNETHLRKLLTFDPRLAMARTTEMGNLALDGQTPLHVAASFGNTAALRVMVEKGEGVSLWVRDLQGRTPLHVAAEKGQLETCEYLRQAMRTERQRDPIGEDAPIDLAGTTPLGWATIGSKGKPKKTDMIKALFSPGDRSILPRTPVSARAGKSPWKAPSSAGYDKAVRESVVFAFSEANGWTPNMEDRIIVSCPLAGRPSWSLFGVCDGHGGSFCSEYLSTHLPPMLAKEAAMLARYMGGSDAEVSGAQLEELLRRVFVDADDQLAQHPRMAVEHVGVERVKYVCLDGSGSTAVLALVTPQLVAVANVGDSRAVLGVRPAGHSGIAGVLSSPFPKSPRSSFSVPHTGEGNRIAEEEAGDVPFSAASHLLEAVGLSRDHKVTIPEERARIEAAGARIEQVGQAADGREPVFQISTPACDVKLRMTRSFGDFYLKQNKSLPSESQAVVAVPEVIVHTRSARDAFIVLACDGIWDVMTNQEVVDFMADKLGFTAYGGPVGGISTQSAAAACDALLQACLERGTVDNISVVLVALGPPPFANVVAQVSARGTPSSTPAAGPQAGNLHDTLLGAAQNGCTPASGRAVASQASHPRSHHSQPARRSSRTEAQDADIDIPIFSSQALSGSSLNEVFAAVADDDGDASYAASPLNAASGSAQRARKHLDFHHA